MIPGRSCPLDYRYVPTVFQREADVYAQTVYVIGGLYGNVQALNAVLKIAAKEPTPPTLIFNGDFNWFNIDDVAFATINREVLKHFALRGNVETELRPGADTAGCGCAYPDYVDDADVERSNAIMQRLRMTASHLPELTHRLISLPMYAVAEIGDARIGIVHGDAESLAGWRFAHDSLHEASNVEWLHKICADANMIGFASSHTCLPTLRQFDDAGKTRIVINNGAAGMPNFAGTQYGLISRIATTPATDERAQYGAVIGGVYIDAIPVHYDHDAFLRDFSRQWPPGSAAYVSYFKRIADGPAYFPPHALGFIRAPSVCA